MAWLAVNVWLGLHPPRYPGHRAEPHAVSQAYGETRSIVMNTLPWTHAHRPSRAAVWTTSSSPPSLAHASPCCHRGCMPTTSPHLPCLPELRGAGGAHAVPAGKRHWYPELHMPPHRLWLRLGLFRATGDLVPIQHANHHPFSEPNPDEKDLPRATWQHSQDTSRVWGNAVASSSDPKFVKPGAIPWLLLEVVGADRGPGGGSRLTDTTYIQRIRTSERRARNRL